MTIIAESSDGAMQDEVVMASVILTKESTPDAEGRWGIPFRGAE